MYSRIVGTGGYLPAAGPDQRRAGAARRYQRRMDPRRAPASASGTSRRRTSRRAISRSPRRARRWRPPASRPSAVDLIVVATTTPDMIFPTTACILQAKLGATERPGVRRAGGVQRIRVRARARRSVRRAAAQARNALVVGAEIYSRILDWNDRGTCVLFGDGAGAVVLVPAADAGHPVDPPARRWPLPRYPRRAGHGVRTARSAGGRSLTMEGNAVFKFAVKVLAEVVQEALTRQRAAGRGDRLADSASGQHADHRGDREEAGPAAGQDGDHGGHATPIPRLPRFRSRSTSRCATDASAPVTT